MFCPSQCKGCRGPCCAAICLVFILVVFGISSLGAGIVVLLVNSWDRASRIYWVDDAAVKWNDSLSPATSWEQFAKLDAYASLTPGKLAKTWIINCTIVAQTIKLSPSECSPNVYHEEAARFASVKQLAFCGGVSYYDFDTCDLQVEFMVVQPKGTVNTSLISIPNRVGIQPVSASIDMYDIEGDQKCSANRGRRQCSSDCKNKCAMHYGGLLSCSDYKCRTNTYVDNLAVKVTYEPGTEQFVLDNLFPIMGPPTHGANALPKGHTWTSSANNTIVMSTTGPGWQYERLTFVPQRPERLNLTLRSSSDPWLAYMAATRGSGYFNVNKGGVLRVSIPLIVIGSILILIALAFIVTHVYGVNLYNRDSTKQPKGWFSGMAWRLAASIHSRNNAVGGAPHVHVTQQPAGPHAAAVPAAVYYTPTSYTSAPLTPGAMYSPSAIGPPPAGSVPYPAPAGSVPYPAPPGSVPYSASPPNGAAPSNSTPSLTGANAITK